MSEEMKFAGVIEMTQRGILWEAREVRRVIIENPPCGHEQCREQHAIGPVIARGFVMQKTAERAMRKLMAEAEKRARAETARRMNEALGG